MGGKPRKKKKRTLEEKLNLLRGWVKHHDDRMRACHVAGNQRQEAEQEAHTAQVIRWALSTIAQEQPEVALMVIRGRQLQYDNTYKAATATARSAAQIGPNTFADILADVVKVLEDRYQP